MHTVRELAKLARVSVRTLHHYDSIGLLKPACVGENRYRYYGEAELLRLQQILFYREFGLSLTEIARYLDEPDFDHIAALRAHRQRLAAEAERYHQLINTIDRTIGRLSGKTKMENAELYKGFSDDKQKTYEDWLIEKYGAQIKEPIDASKEHLKSKTPQLLEDQMAELAMLESALADQMQAGVDATSSTLDDLLSSHRAWVAEMWGRPCSLQAYAGLADLYLSHPDFRARYETICKGFTVYLTRAMKAYAGRR